ncbi:MAG: replication initiation factor domain-containing protein [Nitrospinae bacterium]|nr:replication initiation factor domain-containing protein [Nitrospinota bacterium]
MDLFGFSEAENVGGRAHVLQDGRASVGSGFGAPPAPLPPGSNTGGKMEGTLPEPSWDLQGEGKHGYRFWRAPFGPFRPDWELVYREVEPLETANPRSADVDWLHIVFRLKNTFGNVNRVDRVLRETLGFGIEKELPYGRFNYARQFVLEDRKTLFLVGGEYQRDTAMIAIPGSALQFMDLEKVRKLGEEKFEGWITRVDLCADFFDGQYTVDRAIGDYEEGLYNSGGRKPSHRYVGPLPQEVTEDSEGRTLYIGRRENGKLVRVYEKGKERGIYSGPFSKWVRVELELHGSSPETKKGRVIPWDILARPGCYLAGSCKALAFISETCDKVKTIAVKVVTSLERCAKHVRRMFGPFFNVLRDKGFSDLQIVNLVIRDVFPDWYEKKAHVRSGFEDQILGWCKEIFGEGSDWGHVPLMV